MRAQKQILPFQSGSDIILNKKQKEENILQRTQ